MMKLARRNISSVAAEGGARGAEAPPPTFGREGQSPPNKCIL